LGNIHIKRKLSGWLAVTTSIRLRFRLTWQLLAEAVATPDTLRNYRCLLPAVRPRGTAVVVLRRFSIRRRIDSCFQTMGAHRKSRRVERTRCHGFSITPEVAIARRACAVRHTMWHHDDSVAQAEWDVLSEVCASSSMAAGRSPGSREIRGSTAGYE